MHTQPTTVAESYLGSVTSPRGDVPAKLSASGFACPYYKENPHKYIDCLAYTSIGLVKNVKQHMFRCHKHPDHYCPTCGDKFPTEADTNTHIRARRCDWRDVSHPGMNKDQQARITTITKDRTRGRSDTDKWYDIWEVLFPGRDRPDSPYRGTVEEEMGSALEEFLGTPEYQVILEEDFPKLKDGEGKEKMAVFFHKVVAAYAKKAADVRNEEGSELDLSFFVHEEPGMWQHIQTENDSSSMGN
ncbi:hypothetical protein PG984_012993 [Apiospora sp. TS-2023a]